MANAAVSRFGPLTTRGGVTFGLLTFKRFRTALNISRSIGGGAGTLNDFFFGLHHDLVGAAIEAMLADIGVAGQNTVKLANAQRPPLPVNLRQPPGEYR